MNIRTKWIYTLLSIACLFSIVACSSNVTTPPPNSTVPTTPTTPVVPTVSYPKQIATAAAMGHVMGVDFAAHQNTITDVQREWGKPDQISKVGASNYADYTKQNVTFGYVDGQPISDIRSYDPKLKALTLSMITNDLGQPAETRPTATETIYIYKPNQQFELKFIISNATGKVDHISVYSPQDAAVNVPSVPYMLSIEGTSNQLSATAWAKMQAWRRDIVTFTEAHSSDMFINGPNKKMVALTFDDGPDNVNTPAIIQTLKQYNVKGNFFFIGQKAKMYPDVVKEAYANGDLVLSHSYYHHDLSTETFSEINTDLKMTEDTLYSIIGKRPALLRPPYGATNETVVAAGKANGYKLILWSIDTLDWSQQESAHIQQNVFDNVRNGDIILMHSNEGKEESAKALPGIIAELKRRGFQIVDLQTLLNVRAYK